MLFPFRLKEIKRKRKDLAKNALRFLLKKHIPSLSIYRFLLFFLVDFKSIRVFIKKSACQLEQKGTLEDYIYIGYECFD